MFTTITIVLLGCCIIIYLGTNVRRALLQPYKVSYSFDSFLTPSIHATLKPIIQELTTSSTASDLLAKIQCTIPAITTVCIYRRRPWHIHVQLKASQPIVAINDYLVLTNKGTVTPKNLFIEQSVSGLPCITLDEQAVWRQKTDATELYDFMCSLPTQIKDTHDIIWHDKTHIILVNKLQPYRIVCTSHTRFDSQLNNALKNMDHVIQQRISTQKKKRIWQTDIRFNGFIVLSSTVGEKYENSIT